MPRAPRGPVYAGDDATRRPREKTPTPTDGGSDRKGGSPNTYVGYVGVPHGVELSGQELFYSHVHLHGGTAPVRRYLPKLIKLVWERKINPGRVFDLTLPLHQVSEGYRAMDQRRAIKTLLRP